VTSDGGERKAWAGLFRSLMVLAVGVAAYLVLVSVLPSSSTRYAVWSFGFTAGQVQTFALVVIGSWTVVVIGWALVLYGKRTGFTERYYGR
jgi:hypothetical protein